MQLEFAAVLPHLDLLPFRETTWDHGIDPVPAGTAPRLNNDYGEKGPSPDAVKWAAAHQSSSLQAVPGKLLLVRPLSVTVLVAHSPER
jgi:hypothetical protein